MSSVRELHDKAMNLAQLVVLARHSQDWKRAEELARQAYEHEAQAAELIPLGESSEPTRSILYRSAASLAYQCKEFATAQRLIAKGLSGFPTPQVEQELKDLYEQVNFEHHLKVRGVTLENEDLQLSLQGKGVGFGSILYDEFVKRMKSTGSLIERTVQRLMQAPYQRSGRPSKSYHVFTPTLVAPRASSFAITIKLGVKQGDQMPLLVTASEVIEEIMTGIELINGDNEKGLKDRIQQDSYFRNFISLTKDIAPDGDKISFVGFTSTRRAVSLTRPRTAIDFPPEVEKEDLQQVPIKVSGVLDFASARKQQEIVGLTTQDGVEHAVFLQEGLDDLVKSYFRQWVTVTGMYDRVKGYIYPTDIQSSDE